VLHDGDPAIEVRSPFLYRGHFSDYENTFRIVDEPDFVVELNDTSAGILQSKEWLDWDNGAKSLLPGAKLIFRVQTGVAYKDKTAYSPMNITGKVYVRDQLKTLIPVATVDCTSGVSSAIQLPSTCNVMALRRTSQSFSITHIR
jgi:fatty acid synthase subunit alpha